MRLLVFAAVIPAVAAAEPVHSKPPAIAPQTIKLEVPAHPPDPFAIREPPGLGFRATPRRGFRATLDDDLDAALVGASAVIDALRGRRLRDVSGYVEMHDVSVRHLVLIGLTFKTARL